MFQQNEVVFYFFLCLGWKKGRLLKKSFLGFAILIMAFQANAFGDVVRQSLIDAYLQVSVFVGFTLFIFIGMDTLTRFNIPYVLDRT